MPNGLFLSAICAEKLCFRGVFEQKTAPFRCTLSFRRAASGAGPVGWLLHIRGGVVCHFVEVLPPAPQNRDGFWTVWRLRGGLHAGVARRLALALFNARAACGVARKCRRAR